jgi:hypothetical protein
MVLSVINDLYLFEKDPTRDKYTGTTTNKQQHMLGRAVHRRVNGGNKHNNYDLPFTYQHTWNEM